MAERLLKLREGEISQGKLPGVIFDRIRFDELAEDFLSDYRINKRRSIIKAQRSVKHLEKEFARMPVPQINSHRINRYIEMRMAEGAKNATVNRELSALKRMFSLGARSMPPKVAYVPYIAMLREDNVRKGFFEHGDFLALKEMLPEYLRGFATFGYKTGWRLSEIANLTWSQVDRDLGIVRLEPGETKNSEARTVYLDQELKDIVNQQWEARKTALRLSPYVFLTRKGDKIRRFDRAWKGACKNAGVGNRLFHDFRRTAIRNLVRSGTPETVAMKISGHRTRTVFERYNITSENDLKLAAQRQEVYLESQTVTKSGTISDFERKRSEQRIE